MSVFSKRVFAYILDFIVVSALMWVVSYFIYMVVGAGNVHTIYDYFPFFVAVVILLYFILCEKLAGASMGKAIMRLEVRSKNGAYISWPQAIVRNLTKIYWIPIIFDWAIGKLLKTDRILNNITRTVVIDVS
jgi:uncharacterized RDD family membrane protein YckC